MNRRSFAQRLSALTLSTVFFASTLPQTACTVSDSQIQADAQAIATACGNIAVALKATDAAIADKLSMAASTLSAAAANFTTGTVVADIQTAANAVTAVLAVIPQTAAFAPLVSIAVAALDVLLANLPGAKAAITAHATVPNPFRGQAHIEHRFGRSVKGDFLSAFNTEAAKVGVAPVH